MPGADGTGGPVPPEDREAIREFLYREALALDERRFRDWLGSFAADARYEVPVRVTREKLADWELSPTSRIFDDTRETLELRVRRLETDFAWSEQPPSRTRHFVTNVLVDRAAAADRYDVRSNVLVYRSRGGERDPDLFSVQRRDLVGRRDGRWLIHHRWAAVDQAVVNAHNMSIFL